MLRALGQASETLLSDNAIHIDDNGHRAWQFADTMLGRYFPSGGSTDEDSVIFICNGHLGFRPNHWLSS
jgi:hypothetical protein